MTGAFSRPRAELFVAGLLTAAGLLVAARTEPYNAVSPAMAVTLAAFGAMVGTVLCWYGLRVTEAPVEHRLPAAAWTALPWHTLFLSQLPYIGFALIPLEVALSTWIVGRRGGLRLRAALPLTLAVRIVTLLAVSAGTAALRPIWPWTDQL